MKTKYKRRFTEDDNLAEMNKPNPQAKIEDEIKNCELQLREKELTGSKAQFYLDVEKRLAKLKKEITR